MDQSVNRPTSNQMNIGIYKMVPELPAGMTNWYHLVRIIISYIIGYAHNVLYYDISTYTCVKLCVGLLHNV